MKTIKERLLAVAIAIVLVFFIAYGISTFYESPKYEDFCEEKQLIKLASEEECLAAGGQWTETRAPSKVEEGPTPTSLEEGYCDPDYTCRNKYDDAREAYNKVVFIISAILGLAALIIGGIVIKVEAVSSGVMGGGILTIIYGTIRYWDHLKNIGRFLILGLVLAVLIFIGYKYLKK